MAAFVMVTIITKAFMRLINRRKLNVKILLSDEIKSSRARSLEYYYRPREVMLKGYQQVRNENSHLQ